MDRKHERRRTRRHHEGHRGRFAVKAGLDLSQLDPRVPDVGAERRGRVGSRGVDRWRDVAGAVGGVGGDAVLELELAPMAFQKCGYLCRSVEAV